MITMKTGLLEGLLSVGAAERLSTALREWKARKAVIVSKTKRPVAFNERSVGWAVPQAGCRSELLEFASS
jgi:hypothetical protein